jgi:hypothetical protein
MIVSTFYVAYVNTFSLCNSDVGCVFPYTEWNKIYFTVIKYSFKIECENIVYNAIYMHTNFW